MKQNQNNLMRVALEATAEGREEVPLESGEATGNQDEVPAAGTDDAPVVEPETTVEAIQEVVADEVDEGSRETPADEVLDEDGPLDPDAPELEAGEVDIIDILEDVGEMRDGERALDANASDLKKACVAVHELEDLASSAEETKAVEADTDAGRAVLDLAIESIYNKLGLENPAVALEDGAGFGASMREKVSSIRDQVVRLLRTIIEAVRRAYVHAQEFFASIFNTAAKVERAAMSMRSRVRGLRGSTVGEGAVISNQRLKMALGYTDSGWNDAAFQNMHDLVKDAYESADSGYIDYLNTLIEAFVQDKDIGRMMENFPRVLKRALDGHFPHDSSNAEFDIDGAGDRVDVLTTDLLPGNHVGVLCLPKTTEDLREFEYMIKRTDNAELKDLDVLPPEGLLNVLETVIKTTSIIRKFQRDFKAGKILVSKLEAAVANIESKEDVDLADEDRDFLRSISAIAPALAAGIHERSFAFAISTSANVIRYVDLCIAKLEGKAEKNDGETALLK